MRVHIYTYTGEMKVYIHTCSKFLAKTVSDRFRIQLRKQCICDGHEVGISKKSMPRKIGDKICACAKVQSTHQQEGKDLSVATEI